MGPEQPFGCGADEHANQQRIDTDRAVYACPAGLTNHAALPARWKPADHPNEAPVEDSHPSLHARSPAIRRALRCRGRGSQAACCALRLGQRGRHLVGSGRRVGPDVAQLVRTGIQGSVDAPGAAGRLDVQREHRLANISSPPTASTGPGTKALSSALPHPPCGKIGCWVAGWSCISIQADARITMPMLRWKASSWTRT
jgi:hypothetical protein